MVGTNGSATGKISPLEASLGLIAVTAQVVVGADIGLRGFYLSTLYQSFFGSRNVHYNPNVPISEHLIHSFTPGKLEQPRGEQLPWQLVREIPLHPKCDPKKGEFYQRSYASKNRRSYSFQ